MKFGSQLNGKRLILAVSIIAVLSLGVPTDAVYASSAQVSEPTTDEDVRNHDAGVKTRLEQNDVSNHGSMTDTEKAALISQINEYSTTIYYLLKLNNWKDAETYLTQLKTAAKRLRASSSSRDVKVARLESVIAALSGTLTAKAHQSLNDANQVAILAMQMMAQSNPSIPIEVAMLGYYGRELETLAETKNIDKLKAPTAQKAPELATSSRLQ